MNNKKLYKTPFLIFAVFLLFSMSFFSQAQKTTSYKKTQKSKMMLSKTKQQKDQHNRSIVTGQAQFQDIKKEVSVIMQDPLMKDKWDLKKIKAEKAWQNYSTGSRDIVVAVIDTGVDIHHPDLKNNIWKNPKEIPNNNKDDDNNGFVDDIYGWNFVHNSNDVRDTHGHGTHIAGIIGAEGGNGIGISGVSPKVSLMVLKYYDPNDPGKSNLENTRKSIEYAIHNGAHIINYSGGGLSPDIAGQKKLQGKKNNLFRCYSEQECIKEAGKKGILFVAAAGNEGSNIDKSTKYYPASYGYENILSVANTGLHGEVLKSSNQGITVTKSAPGYQIISTFPDGKYGRMTGTSQATAVASGAAVLIMTYYKTKEARFVIKQLKMTGDINSKLEGKTNQRRSLDIFKALQARGMQFNFVDEKVDFSGKVYPSDRNIADANTDLKNPNNVEEITMALKHLKSQKKEKKSSVPEEQTKRTPSSPQKKNLPATLKRWFFEKTN